MLPVTRDATESGMEARAALQTVLIPGHPNSQMQGPPRSRGRDAQPWRGALSQVLCSEFPLTGRQSTVQSAAAEPRAVPGAVLTLPALAAPRRSDPAPAAAHEGFSPNKQQSCSHFLTRGSPKTMITEPSPELIEKQSGGRIKQDVKKGMIPQKPNYSSCHVSKGLLFLPSTERISYIMLFAFERDPESANEH